MANKVSQNKRLAMQTALLDWFDRHQRVMPWRATRGRRPNAYHVWLSEIMLQQTTVAAVGPYFLRFVARWPTVDDLAAATQDEVLAEWAGLGYYARARNLHKCAKAVAALGGAFPRTLEGLQDLPGIGPYTAAAIASIAFDIPAVAVDGNVERVVSRIFAITEPLPLSKPAIREGAAALAQGVARPGDFTQAFMELGATVCTPRNPQCGLCPWRDDCRARAQGIAQQLPAKLAKKAKPQRQGRVYVLCDDKGRVLIEKRQGKGLYEGMYQLPTTDWQAGPPADDKAARVATGLPARGIVFDDQAFEVRHSLTHFDLILQGQRGTASVAAAEKLASAAHRRWVAPAKLGDYGIPEVMKKALALAGVIKRARG